MREDKETLSDKILIGVMFALFLIIVCLAPDLQPQGETHGNSQEASNQEGTRQEGASQKDGVKESGTKKGG